MCVSSLSLIYPPTLFFFLLDSVCTMARKSKGRQKLDMVKIPNESSRQVTFSKRRSGIFKKASELCTLCGAEVAIIVFSPGKKVFSFGHPGVEVVVERFLTRHPPQNSPAMQLIEAHRNAGIREFNAQLTQVYLDIHMKLSHLHFYHISIVCILNTK